MSASTTDLPKFWRGIILTFGIGVFTLVVTFVVAKLTGSSTGGVIGGVENLSSLSSSTLGAVASYLPLGFAFGAGMVSSVNPCGFAMLTAYLGLYTSTSESTSKDVSMLQRLLRGLLVGSSVTLGFVLLFTLFGGLIVGGARSVVGIFPWVGLAVGVILVFLGAWLVQGGKFYSNLAGAAASRIGDPNVVSVKGYFLFGASYGIASLGCTLPIFLAVMGTSLASRGVLSSIGQIVVYALGMGSVISILTVSIALFKGTYKGVTRKIMPYLQPIMAVLMVLAGAYIVFYWLTIGGLLKNAT